MRDSCRAPWPVALRHGAAGRRRSGEPQKGAICTISDSACTTMPETYRIRGKASFLIKFEARILYRYQVIFVAGKHLVASIRENDH
jgi:hypothetical protein